MRDRETHGKLDLGSFKVAFHDLDILQRKSCPIGRHSPATELEKNAQLVGKGNLLRLRNDLRSRRAGGFLAGPSDSDGDVGSSPGGSLKCTQASTDCAVLSFRIGHFTSIACRNISVIGEKTLEMAPVRRYLRITKYSVLECRIYLDNPALAQSWLLNPRYNVLPRVIESVRPLVLPKLREEKERERLKKKASKKSRVKDVIVRGRLSCSQVFFVLTHAH